MSVQIVTAVIIADLCMISRPSSHHISAWFQVPSNLPIRAQVETMIPWKEVQDQG